jgi:hypothetical protein
MNMSYAIFFQNIISLIDLPEFTVKVNYFGFEFFRYFPL